MSINLDKKYEKYLSKYNQLFTQMNGGGFFSTAPKQKTESKTESKTEQISNHDKRPDEKLKLLKEKLVTGNIYRMIDIDGNDDDYFYLYVKGDFVYLIEATKDEQDTDWEKSKYTVEQVKIDGYEQYKNGTQYKPTYYNITEIELKKALDEKEWCGEYFCLDNIIKPEGQLKIIPI